MASKYELEKEIIRLKKEKNVLFLSHFYEDGEVQDLADEIGDSLFLAQRGEASTAPVVLLAGVVFMGESVKILSPGKKVIVPDLNAGCSLVKESPFEKYLEWRRKFPNHIAVTYVNSSAEVKSISDVVCTSSNAEKIIASIPKDRGILFGPDKQLGKWLSKKAGRPMELWQGACEVHILFSAQKLNALKNKHPDALVLAHPECSDGILGLSDVVGSTSRLLKEVETNLKYKKFIVATEDGIFHMMKKARADAELIQAPFDGDETCACNQCPYMKLNTLEKIHLALKTLKPEITLETKLMERAKVSLDRMMKITRGEQVEWPESFSQ